MTEWKGPERRKTRRVNVPFDVSFAHGGSTLACKTGNVSLHGFFVETATPPAIGSMVRFILKHAGLPDGLEVLGRVAHVRSGQGMGVQIKQISQGHDEAFDRYCQVIERALYADSGKK